jgi:hypothetical protein
MLFSPQLIIPTRSPIAAAGGGGGGESTVLIDVTGNAAATRAGNVSGLFTPGGGSNGTTNMVALFALACLNDNSGVVTSPACIWDATGGSPQTATLLSGLTLVGSPSNSDVFFFGLVNPHLGALVANFNWTGGNPSALAFALTAVSADQTGGTTTFTNLATNSGSGTSQSVTSSAPSTRLTVATCLNTQSFSAENNTRIILSNTANVSAIGSQYAAAGTTAFSWTAANSAYVANAISIKGA